MKDPRDRLTSGVTRGRLALEARRSLPYVPTLILAVVATLVGAAAIFSQLSNTLFKSTNEYRFAVDDAYGVLPGVDDVRYRGVPAGTIKEVERDGIQPVLRVSLRSDFPTIYKDVRAELRPETPLNDQYLDIVDPGTPQAGELDGDVVSAARTSTNVKINDVLNTLEANERTRLSQLLDNLGNGLGDRGDDLRIAVATFTPFVRSATVLAEQLAQRKRSVKRLVSNAATLTEALGERETEIRRLVSEGAATLGTLQAGSADLDATLRALPGTTRAIDSSFRAVTAVLDDVDRAVGDLRPIAEDLPQSLATVRRLEDVLGPAVSRLARPVERLVPFARALRPVASELSRTVDALAPQTDSIDKTTTSLVKCEAGIKGFFQWNASLSKFGDVRGPVPRGNLAMQAPDLGVPGVAKRVAPENCAGGVTLNGRTPTKEDEG